MGSNPILELRNTGDIVARVFFAGTDPVVRVGTAVSIEGLTNVAVPSIASVAPIASQSERIHGFRSSDAAALPRFSRLHGNDAAFMLCAI